MVKDLIQRLGSLALSKLVMLFLVFPGSLFSQSLPFEIPPDSLASELQQASPAKRARLYSELASHYRNTDLQQSLKYAEKAVQIAATVGDSLLQANAHYELGLSLYLLGDYQPALVNYQKALDFFLYMNETGKAAAILNEIGTFKKKQGDIERAFDDFNRALEISRAGQDTGQIANSLNNMGIVYDIQGDYEQAMAAFKTSADLKKQMGDIYGLTYNLDNMAMVQGKMQKYREAEKLFQQAAELREELGDLRGLGVIYNNMGEMYMMKKSYSVAREYFLKALSIAEKTNYNDFRQHVYKMLSEAFAHEQDFKNSLTYFKMHTQLKDSLFNETRSRQLLELETKYETEKKEQQIALQKAQLSEQAAQLERNYAVFGILALLLIFLFISFYFYRVQLDKKQELALKKAELNASITSQEKERKRFARDLHDGMGQLISACRLQLSNLVNLPKLNQRQSLNEKLDLILLEMHGEIRNIAFNLMPSTLIQSGLAPAIKELSERINETNGLQIRVFDFEMHRRLTETREIFLYRVVQEWLNNVIKYAGAKTVEIQILNHSDELLIMIEDDGKGFDPLTLARSKGHGWSNIQSRINHIGAKVEIDSRPGYTGTTFVVTVPEPFSQNGKTQKKGRGLHENISC